MANNSAALKHLARSLWEAVRSDAARKEALLFARNGPPMVLCMCLPYEWRRQQVTGKSVLELYCPNMTHPEKGNAVLLALNRAITLRPWPFKKRYEGDQPWFAVK
ncbi:hypothetical protein QOT17_014422 [Balamuthia mandrillaris]